MPRIPCEVCGALFYAKPSRITAGYGRFCGGTCYGAQKQTRVEITCIVCGKPRTVKPFDLKRGAKYCGDPCARLDKAPTKASTRERFWDKVVKEPLTWRWTAAVNNKGYGNFLLSKTPPKWVLAHHFAWWDSTGYWPKRHEIVLHACDVTCDTPLCVRNDDEGIYEIPGRPHPLPRRGHLALGTQADNVADMMIKGRHRPRGPVHHCD